MLKMYQASHTQPGDSPEFWDSTWESTELMSVLGDASVCENDPLFSLLQEKVRPDRLFLEGGCGQAQWVKYFSERGQQSVGIDFAARTVDAVKRVFPGLDVRVGNILALPFADGAVHTYYSGGVVEHFEGGPDPALVEARRVIADDGWFLCSVPDHSPLRGQLFRAESVAAPKRDPRSIVRRVERTAEEPQLAGMQFFQYAFTEAEFCARLQAAGFAVERTFGYAIVWGLTEVPGVQRFIDTLSGLKRRLRSAPAASANDAAPAVGAPVGQPAANGRPPVGLLRRALVREDPATPLLGPMVRLLRDRCANMRMYVARPARR